MDRCTYTFGDYQIMRYHFFQTLNISASRSDERVTITLIENIIDPPYQRTFTVYLKDDDTVSLPNDLNGPTQNILRTIAAKFNHPNTAEGDAFGPVSPK